MQELWSFGVSNLQGSRPVTRLMAPTTAAEPSPGIVIAGRYTLEQKISEEGMGEGVTAVVIPLVNEAFAYPVSGLRCSRAALGQLTTCV